MPEKIILGIDPGTNIMGYGLIRIVSNRAELITLGVLHLGKVDGHALKLKKIFEKGSFNSQIIRMVLVN